MEITKLSLLAVAAALSFPGCERKTVIVEVPAPTAIPEPLARTKTSRLGAAVDAYRSEPSAARLADAKKALADLDGEIAELEILVAKRNGESRQEAAVKLRNLQSYRAGEVARLTAAQATASLSGAVPAEGRTGAEKVEDSARRVGNTIEDAARKTGDAIKDAVR